MKHHADAIIRITVFFDSKEESDELFEKVWDEADRLDMDCSVLNSFMGWNKELILDTSDNEIAQEYTAWLKELEESDG